jgi:hypothetical protein
MGTTATTPNSGKCVTQLLRLGGFGGTQRGKFVA